MARNWPRPARFSRKKEEKIKGKGAQKLVEIIARAAESKKAMGLKILDVRKTSNITDYLVICSGESSVQIRAIEKEIDLQLRKNKIKGFRWEGVASSGWMVLDLGKVVVHVMKEEERNYYKLEELWERGAIVYHY